MAVRQRLPTLVGPGFLEVEETVVVGVPADTGEGGAPVVGHRDVADRVRPEVDHPVGVDDLPGLGEGAGVGLLVDGDLRAVDRRGRLVLAARLGGVVGGRRVDPHIVVDAGVDDLRDVGGERVVHPHRDRDGGGVPGGDDPRDGRGGAGDGLRGGPVVHAARAHGPAVEGRGDVGGVGRDEVLERHLRRRRRPDVLHRDGVGDQAPGLGGLYVGGLGDLQFGLGERAARQVAELAEGGAGDRGAHRGRAARRGVDGVEDRVCRAADV